MIEKCDKTFCIGNLTVEQYSENCKLSHARMIFS